jgi:hypothetical protein
MSFTYNAMGIRRMSTVIEKLDSFTIYRTPSVQILREFKFMKVCFDYFLQQPRAAPSRPDRRPKRRRTT